MHIPSTKKKCQFQKYISLDYSQSPLIFFDQSFETTFQQKNILEFDLIIPFAFPWKFHRNLKWGNFKSMGREFLHFA